MVSRIAQCLILGVLLFIPVAHAELPGNFTEREHRILKSLSLAALGPVPPSPSNRVADDDRAVNMGRALFFDKNLSVDGSLSCATCHQPEKAFTDGKPLAEGIDRTGRNTPTLYGAAYLDWLYWDGRRDTLWSQALIPFEAPSEMGSSRVGVVRRVLSDPDYQENYRSLFGTPPEFDWESLPDHAAPIGDTVMQNAWHRLRRGEQRAINTVFANIGKALDAFQRTLAPPETRFDRFVSALNTETTAPIAVLATDQELRGMKLYMDDQRTQCLRCHNGPMFSNGGFHNIGTGKFSGEGMDFGRVFGLQAVLMDEFNCLGIYSDAEPDQCEALGHVSQDPHQALHGAFKTPSLRYLEKSKPYFHDGRFSSLEEVIRFYQTPPDQGRNRIHELQAMDLNTEEIVALVAFLKMLN
ncbi:cytochrome-c peroxidase [Marinobacter salicampi]|uniref:cytochrome-c peroxidase n=1 Tax=Marinobacter salicampi TaxID=435907 RepID=UPI00140C4730|nr:cytochrome c peroxidase [Marinobacter salicampi]